MATILGKIILPNQAVYVGSILFRPLSTPLVDSPSLISTADVSVTSDALGQFSQVLSAGVYKVFVGASKPFEIEVPDDTNSYQLLTLIRSQIWSTTLYQWSGGSGNTVSLATSTTSGTVRTSSDDADPVCILESDADARYIPLTTAGGSSKFENGHFFLWNPTTGKWHQLFLFGAEGAVQLTYGPGED
jgi:hypothetical protein